ncbi:uncharacterized protein BDZ99DRAFT_457814 [Mytilinidion resinicola]|uniref:Uncharacterized protein n=1 Tax=Mytilinidion resinicola TaxID=574789 RepID=A0A6A6Z4B2_9PEZI|nr:uncharacterized protein BDZ99DRAFT_457814 [Mytilinidion resinicola]KAF2815870.1 hypothetical protein BDZ99DRAFT_457814 [Mytilinidion resinicola]
MTEWLSRCDRPGQTLAQWDPTKRYNFQPDSVPSVFKDAMSIREAVYVDEQSVPLAHELDDDDPRSFHFVMYASIATKGASASSHPAVSPEEEERRRSIPSAVRTPIATIRLIPPPHGPNPYKNENKDHHPDSAPTSPVGDEHPVEPYIKLGRLATLKAFRGGGLSRQLIHAALDFAAANPDLILAPRSPVSQEWLNLERVGSREEKEKSKGWQGLAMVHAQASVEGLWKRHGFSEELLREDGTVEVPKEERWWEEGIEHLAMWCRVPIKHEKKTQTLGGKEGKSKFQMDWENL